MFTHDQVFVHTVKFLFTRSSFCLHGQVFCLHGQVFCLDGQVFGLQDQVFGLHNQVFLYCKVFICAAKVSFDGQVFISMAKIFRSSYFFFLGM